MAGTSTRQTFVKGQVVWIHAYQTYWRKATVTDPDFRRAALTGGREIHYVKVRYFDNDGRLAGGEWNILNNRKQISNDAAHDLVLRDKEISARYADVRQHETWESTHAAYVDQANHIIALVELLGAAPDTRAENVALYLRSAFSLKDKRTRDRITVEDITRVRRELAHKATAARGRLQELDAKAWS